MDEIDVWRAARKMIELYDTEAGWNAGLRADHLLEQGDVDAFHAWVRISRAIMELQKDVPTGKDPLN